MNDKKKSTSVANLDLGELDNLEDELNELSGNKEPEPPKEAGGNIFSSYFGGSDSTPSIVKEGAGSTEVPLDDLNEANLGEATSGMMGSTKTWDGFVKANEVPTNQEYRPSTNLSEREKRRKKRLMLKKLEEWKDKGMLKDAGNFTMESNFDEIEDEYEGAMEENVAKIVLNYRGGGL